MMIPYSHRRFSVALLALGIGRVAPAQSDKARATSVHSPSVVGDLRLQELTSQVFRNKRFLRVLLPDGYDAPENRDRHYAVLYLADGQNLFDPATSVFGPSEWRVDETVHQLVSEGRIPPMIVVGVDDAGRTGRGHEYLPYPDTANARRDPSYDPDPQGKRYPDFLINEVMPFINARYRTLRDADHTGLGGSSWGGLISVYVMAVRPGVFGRALIESPTFSVYGGQVLRDVASAKSLPGRVYVAVGTNEDGAPNCKPEDTTRPRDGMVVGVDRMAAILRGAGLDSSRARVVVEPCATHTHAAWAKRLPSALTFLFGAQARDTGARMERMSDGVYAIIHDNATEDWPNSNTGVVVGETGVLVVDATYLPSRARADIALIRSVTDKPVRYLVITHLHRDHNGGTSAYRDAFPEVQVVSGPQTREFIAINRAATARAAAASGSPVRNTLAALEARLASGRDSAGRPLAPDVQRALEVNVRQRQIEMEDLSSLRVIVPDVAVKNELDLFLGSRRIEIRDRGRANSPDDVTVYLPAEQVLFTGDIVVQSPMPYTGATWPVEWSAVLRDLEAMPVAAIMPGHGPVMHDHTYTHAMRGLIDGVSSQVATMLSQGLTLAQMQERVDATSLRAASPAWAGADLDEDWKITVRALVDRAWHALRGLD
jgi:predicted alpha/beta superfamily hydrolase/glyoxylase-like metal-dependent hydrolase (beta-lactamase superfamily II)